MKKPTKQLKRNKALGPDEVPNELFIEANNYTIQLLTDLLNIVHMRKKHTRRMAQRNNNPTIQRKRKER